MLVLSRTKNESIMIGDDIEITIVDVRGDKIRLGIVAPNHVPVHRKEVYLAIKEENERAATVEISLDGLAGMLSAMKPGTAQTNAPPQEEKGKNIHSSEKKSQGSKKQS